MANASVRSATARIGSLSYADLEELKAIKIPKDEQKAVRKEMKRAEKKKNSERAESDDVDLETYETGSPLKCVRIPKREQRYTQMTIDETNANK